MRCDRRLSSSTPSGWAFGGGTGTSPALDQPPRGRGLRGTVASVSGDTIVVTTASDLRPGSTVEVVLINCHYPVSHNSFVLQWGLAVQRAPGVTEEQAGRMARGFSTSFGEGFLEDVAVWRNKTRIDNPLLTEEDGAVYQHRRWYEQFYTDIADVTDDMTNRFELEIDTSHANVMWHDDVSSNIGARIAAPAVNAD